MTRLTWRGPRNVVYSKYPTLDFAKRVFMSTGTLVTQLEGYYVTDGGVTNGCPLFDDGARPQLVVRPFRAGLPGSMAVGFSLAQGAAAVERGVDDALAFLGARVARNASGSLALATSTNPTSRKD